MENIEKRIKILYKKVTKDENATERACEGYIKVLNGIKDELIDKGKLGEWDLEDVQIGGFLGASEEDIDEAMGEIEAQLDEIASGLGIDLDEEEQNIKHNGVPTFNISLNQNQSQHQEQHQSQSMNLEILKRELEKELRKDYPNESKVKNMINDIIDIAKSSAPGIITGIILKILGA